MNPPSNPRTQSTEITSQRQLVRALVAQQTQADYRQLQAIVQRPDDKSASALTDLVRVAARLRNSLGAGLVQHVRQNNAAGIFRFDEERQFWNLAENEITPVRECLEELCQLAMQRGDVQRKIFILPARKTGKSNASASGPRPADPVLLLCLPLESSTASREYLVAALQVVNGVQPDDSRVRLVAQAISERHLRTRLLQSEQHLRATAVTVDLAADVSESPSVRAACQTLANHLQTACDAKSAVIGLCSRHSKKCPVQAISGRAKIDRKSKTVRIIQAALEEAVVRNEFGEYPAANSASANSLLAHRKLAELLNCESVSSSVLRTADGNILGAWLVFGNTSCLQAASSRIVLKDSAPRIASALEPVIRLGHNPFSRRRRKRQFVTLFIVAFIWGIAGWVLMMPVAYPIQCTCAAAPVKQRFVVAPYTGRLERTLVRPGEIVHQNQLLAQMDGREIRLELATLAAERAQADRQADISFVAGDVASAQLSELESKRIQLRENLFRERLGQLEIKAPLTGIVLSGDLDRVENAPVKTGATICEIAPLDSVIVEIEIPVDEFPHLTSAPGSTEESTESVGQQLSDKVTIIFDGLEDNPRETRLTDVRPRSEIRDGRNVFVAEIELPNSDHELRPGMHGTATVQTAERTLAWNLFHKPWNRIRRWFPYRAASYWESD